MDDHIVPYITGSLLLIATAILYLFTLDNGLRPDELVGGDLITHQYAQVEARPSNAPGYPLYTMGGWLWFNVGRTLLSWALNPIQILSLYSTLWGLASLLVLYLILLEVTQVGGKPSLNPFQREGLGRVLPPLGRVRGGQMTGNLWPIAPLLTAFYATTFFFWYYSVTTEQYTSAVFQTLLIIWLAFKFDASPRDSTLLWLAFVSGTMLANMITTLFILPPLLWFIFSRKINSKPALLHYLHRPKFVAKAVGLGLLPLLSYVYIYIRGAQHPEWRGAGEWPSTWAWFVQFLTIQQGRDELAPGLRLQTIITAEFPSLMWQELTWIVFFGGLLGLAALDRRRAIFLYGTLAIYFIFSWGYRFGNWFQVIIPAYPIFVIGFAAGLKRIGEWVNERKTKDERRRTKDETRNSPVPARGKPETRLSPSGGNLKLKTLLTPHSSLIIVLLTGLLIYRFATNLPRANQHSLPADTGLIPGWLILADNPHSPAIIISNFEERVALQYLRTVWGLVPRLTPIDATEIKQSPKNDTRTIYISRGAAAASPALIRSNGLHPQAAGEQLIMLSATPNSQLPPTAYPVHLNFGEAVQLIGWEQIQADPHLPPNVAHRPPTAHWQIVLFWQALAPLSEDYAISVRPLVGGQLIFEEEKALIQDHQPVWGVYPTSRWTPGELVRDVYALELPVQPEAVQIVVYKATDTGFEDLGTHTIDVSNPGWFIGDGN